MRAPRPWIPGPRPRECAPTGRAPSPRTLPREVRLAHPGPKERVVARRDEAQRLPHHGGLEDGASRELALERLAPEARRARPDADVRRRRPLRLHSDQALDHRLRQESLPLEQQLPGERRAVQLAQREDTLGHAATLSTSRPSIRDAAIGWLTCDYLVTYARGDARRRPRLQGARRSHSALPARPPLRA